MSKIIADFNWLDVIYLVILCGMVYNGSHTGIGKQLLSLFWWVVLIFFSLHFYNVLASKAFSFMVQYWAKPLAFVIITGALFFIVKLLNTMFNIQVAENMAPLERVGGGVLAAMRALLFFGMVGIVFLLIPFQSFQNAVLKKSYSAMRLVEMDAGIYSWLTSIFHFVQKTEKEKVIEKLLISPERRTK